MVLTFAIFQSLNPQINTKNTINLNIYEQPNITKINYHIVMLFLTFH